MLKKLSVIVILAFMVPFVLVAQDRKIDKKAPIQMNEPTTVQTSSTIGGNGTLAANFVAVDTMQNGYGPAISAINPLAYDPSADVLAVVYRGATTYAQGSGELWYSISTDRGLTWTRVPAGINAATAFQGRYPSMAISNPTGGGIGATTGAFSWPELVAGAFGGVGYGADQPLGGGTTFAGVDPGPPLYSSQVPTFTSDNANWMLWASDNQTDAAIRIFRTEDFGTIETIDDPNLNSAAFGDGGSITGGGASHNGVLYYGFVGTMPDPNPADPIISGWYPGYSKSTDNGATWSPIVVADFRTIPALNAYDRLFDYKKLDAFVSYHIDVNVDANGYVHLVTTVTDTVGSDNTGINALVDIYETASGWDGKVIWEGFSDNLWTEPLWGGISNNAALGQMGPSGYLATSKDRDVLVATWVNAVSLTDSIADIFYSWRSVDGEWSTPINITETPDINEIGSHLANFITIDGNVGYLYPMYWYQEGVSTYTMDPLQRCVVYVAPVSFTVTDVSDPNVVYSFDLGQNYPNPFNPSTSISYSVPERSNVSIKVYDVLGKEVATLVNTTKESGSYSVNFDATNLASGMYIYTLNAGNFTSSKKMMILK